jgi:hypothetical protein
VERALCDECSMHGELCVGERCHMDICAEFIYICDNLTKIYQYGIVYGIDLDVLPDLFKYICFCWFLNFVHD